MKPTFVVRIVFPPKHAFGGIDPGFLACLDHAGAGKLHETTDVEHSTFDLFQPKSAKIPNDFWAHMVADKLQSYGFKAAPEWEEEQK